MSLSTINGIEINPLDFHLLQEKEKTSSKIRCPFGRRGGGEVDYRKHKKEESIAVQFKLLFLLSGQLSTWLIPETPQAATS